MERHLGPLIFFSVLGLVIGLLMIVPEEEMLAVLVYLPVLVIWAVILYKKSVKPIDPDFLSTAALNNWGYPESCRTGFEYINYHFRTDEQHKFAFDLTTWNPARNSSPPNPF